MWLATGIVKAYSSTPESDLIGFRWAAQLGEFVNQQAPAITASSFSGATFFVAMGEAQSLGITGNPLTPSQVGGAFATGAIISGGVTAFTSATGLGLAYRSVKFYNPDLNPGELKANPDALVAPGVNYRAIELTFGNNKVNDILGIYTEPGKFSANNF